MNDDFKQSAEPRKYHVRVALRPPGDYTLATLVEMARYTLKDRFGISNLSISEGIILRKCVEAATEREEIYLKENLSRGKSGQIYDEACYAFLSEVFELPVHLIDCLYKGYPPAWDLIVWMEMVRDKAHSNGLDSRPFFDRHIAYQAKREWNL